MKITYIAPTLDVIAITTPVLLAGSETIGVSSNSFEDDKDSEGLILNGRDSDLDDDF